MRWQDKLTRSERQHCSTWNMRTLTALQRSADHQTTIEFEYSTDDFSYNACFECRSIFNKLGIVGIVKPDARKK